MIISKLTWTRPLHQVGHFAMNCHIVAAAFCLALLLTIQVSESATTVNPINGGYTFTIGIHENVKEPANETELSSFISKIRENLRRFSAYLHFATRNSGKFHVESVNILLPATWSSSFVSSYPDSITETYSTADIKLSNVTQPYVANPNQCGFPGHHIELPADFFTGYEFDETYGSKEKALLTLWARFRWGVYEEHGYPSMERFPYFYRTVPGNDSSWEVTGCSNTKLDGVLKNTTGELCDAPDTNCRFHPADTNTATRSLMGFHWLPEVKEFCDETTHNKLAPNKQNAFCNYRSVREVIESSQDYAEFPEPIDAIPDPTLNIIKANPSPVFHLLLDRGFIDNVENPENLRIMQRILRELLPIFTEPAFGAVSTFYSVRDEWTGETQVENLIHWKKMGDNLDEFIDVVSQFRTDYPPLRDFTLGLSHVISSIHDLNPHGGAIVLVVKSGATDTYFGLLQASELEIIASAIESKIRVYAAEIRHRPELPMINLENLVNKTGGLHTVLDDFDSVPDRMGEIVRSIITELDNPALVFPDNDNHVIFNGKLAANSSLRLGLPSGIVDGKIHLTLSAYLTPILRIGDTEPQPLENPEWGEEDDFTRRTVSSFTLTQEQQGNLDIQFHCSGCTESVVADLFVTGDLYSHPFADVEVYSETNAIGGQLDFQKFSAVPFTIHTSVLDGRRPVTNAFVEATIIDSIGNKTIIVLTDDGSSFLDVQSEDGIYSGAFVPESNGVHKISLKVETAGAQNQNPRQVARNELSRLLPVDQEQIGCPESECGGTRLDSFFRLYELPDVLITNVESFQRGTPESVTDFAATAFYDEETPEDIVLRLTFTSPRILGVSTSSAKASKYFVLGSNNWDNLHSLVPNADIVQEVTITQAPGSTEVVRQTLPSTANLFQYYVVYAFYSDFPIIPDERKVKSNIAPLVHKPREEEPVTQTPEPPTTVEPISSSSSPITDPETDPSTTPDEDIKQTTTEEPDDDDDKPFFKTAGGIVVIILIVLLGLTAIGGGFVYYMKYMRSKVP